ncbi:hypothetical protein ACFLTE_12405, partial [Bacteroidota bacterium]
MVSLVKLPYAGTVINKTYLIITSLGYDMKRKVIILLFFLFSINSLYSQNSDSIRYTNINNGISTFYGMGKMGIKDEYISNEKYSGIINCYGLYWSRYHSKYLYRIGIEQLSGEKLKNNNITTEIMNIHLHQAYLYFIRKFKEPIIGLGPSFSMLYFENSPLIAGNNIDSKGGYIYLGIDGIAQSSLTKNFSYEIFSKLGIMSFKSRYFSNEAEFKIQTPITNTFFNTKIQLNYK